MSVATVKAQFATVWLNFSSNTGNHIETAFPTTPRLVHPAQLPCVLTFAGPARYNYDDFGEQIVTETREYRCMLMVSMVTLGNEETGGVLLEPYFSAVRAYFGARPGLENDSESAPRTVVAEARILRDNGEFITEYPTYVNGDIGLGLFNTIEFTFEITELATITYKD